MNPLTKPFKVYQASAGSGKTYTIVKEYLALCLQSEAATSQYNHILAITFTNKAANEMKEKILDHLNTIINSDPEKEPGSMEKDLIDLLQIDRDALKTNAKKLFYKIIHDYSNFCISTIDAFFQKVARSFAKDLNLPNQFSVSIDEDEVADAITERLGEQLGSSNPFLTKIMEDYSETMFDNGKRPKVEINIHAFIKKLFEEEAYQKNEQNHFETEKQNKATLASINKKINDFEKWCQESAADFDTFMNNNGLTTNDFKNKSKSPILMLVNKVKENKYDPLTKTQLSLLNGDYQWYSDKKHAALDPEFQTQCMPFLRTYHQKIGNYLFNIYQLDYLSLYVLRSKIKSEIEAYIGEEMVVHISEFNKRINEILGDFSVPFIYERMGEHFHHIFIDEFQDTSVLQWQNIIPLIDNNLANRHLNMIVGDGKQSIYRWRNGEVGQIASLPRIYAKPADSPFFDQFEQNLINSFQFNELDCNFRSFSNIVQFNNTFFEFSSKEFLSEKCKKIYFDNDETLHKEIKIKQKTKQQEEGLVEVELFDPKEKPEEAMLARVYELVTKALEQGFTKGDIAVLVRKNDYGSLVANYLHEKGIAVISPESILLKSSNKVQLIVNTLNYLIHPESTPVISNVLYYWKRTHDTSFNGDVSDLFNTVNSIAEGQTSLEEMMSLQPGCLQDLLSNSYSLYDLCSAIARTYGFNTLGDSFLNFLLDIVFQWQSADKYGIELFLEYWWKKEEKLSILTSETDAVSIMTIHKSKGLEFPVVIYPFVCDNIDDTKSAPLWFTAEELGFEPIPNVEKVQFNFSEKRSLWSSQVAQKKQDEADKTRLDNMNLNYVAFTRPVQRLYILTEKMETLDNSPINAFLQKKDLEFQLELQENQNEEEWPVIYRIGNPEKPKVTEKKHQNKQSTTSFYNESSATDWLERITIDSNPSMFWMNGVDRFEPLEWGKFVHKILSEITCEADLDKVLTPYLDNGFIDEATSNMLRNMFTQMIHHPALQEAFSQQAKVKNECELLSNEFGIQRPDRYAELPDKIILLDYKTGKPSEKHHEQLQHYITILQKMEKKNIEAFLVYLGDTVDVIQIEN